MRVDRLFTGGMVFVSGSFVSREIAVDGGRIVALGERLHGEVVPDDVVDVSGTWVLPGFQDAHVHPIHAGLRRLRCDLTECDDLDAAIGAIARSVATDEPWLLGGGWAFEWFERGCPSADLLESLAGGKPAYLVVRDGHSAWVNHRALERAGVTRDTPDPPDGRIERLADGTPQGTLHEGAMDLVERVVGEPTPDELDQALLEGQRVMFMYGVTGWQDAWVTPDYHAAYRRTASDGRLVAHVRGALWWDRDRTVAQVDDLAAMAAEGVGGYDPRSVKFMVDGVCENFTASMLAPYEGAHGGSSDHVGIDFIKPGDLIEAVAAVRAVGLQSHFHAIGDAAVRSSLDAIGEANRTVGDLGTRDHIAHIQVVHPDDIPRFAEVGAFATCQTLWACNEPAMTELTIPFLGPERSRWQYPFASIAAAGGRLAMGSDWPVSSPNVLEQIEVAATRTPVEGGTDPFVPREALTVGQALAGWTLNSASVNHSDGERGTIAIGRAADLAMVDGDPFGPDPGMISVDSTWVEGNLVHGRWV